jgi:hypothetical protein
MSIYLENQEIFNGPLRLTLEQRANPQQVFVDFIDDYSLSLSRDWIWKMVNTCQISDDPLFNDRYAREDLLLFGERLEALLEAVSLQLKLKPSPSKPAPQAAPKEIKKDSSECIDLGDLQTRVVGIQADVAELVLMVVTAYCNSYRKGFL